MNPGAYDVTFALIAVRERYVALEDLLSAMSEAKTSGLPLDQLLVRCGLLDEERRAAVEAAVRHQLEGHDAPEHTFPAPAYTPTAPLGPRVSGGVAGETLGGRYSIVRQYAMGGLGVVWLAHDQEVNREIALKEIQAEHASHPGWKQRFMQEAEITGRLEHPGVVPVYGMGRREDGRPFYAMRLIRGRTLQEEIETYHAGRALGETSERVVAFRKLLEHFISACHTIEHAHSRGILHRDIKPANIMVGRHGETVILDWGLAKPVEQVDTRAEVPPDMGTIDIEGGSARTVMGSTIGTPQYMSPEQAKGRLDLLGMPSDVYSLGATLYCILTGRAPVEKGPAADVMARAGRGEFPRPRSVHRGVPSALEAVCLKAMAFEIPERYASPTALEEDVERWLADEPTTAFQETPSTRMARWVRRHRLIAMVSVAALILVTSVSVISRSAIKGALSHEQAARLAAQKRLKDATEATGKLVEVTSKVRELPGGRSVTRSLLATAEVLYATLERDSEGEPEIRFQAAKTKSQLARALWVYGDLSGAIERYQSALDTVTQLRQAQPTSREYRTQLASMQRSLADLFADLPDGERDAQRQTLLEASKEELESLLREFEGDQRLRISLAQTLSSLGALNRTREPAIAVRTLERARELFDALILLPPEPPRSRGDDDRRWIPWFGRGRVRHELGMVAEERGDFPEAQALYDSALADMEQAAEKSPSLPLYAKQRMTATRSEAGRLLLRMGRLDEAERLIAQSHHEHATALEGDRESWRLALEAAQDGWAMSALHARRGRTKEAEEALVVTLESLRKTATSAQTKRVPAPLTYAIAMTASSLGLLRTARADASAGELLAEAVRLVTGTGGGEPSGTEPRAVRAIALANASRAPGMPPAEAAARVDEALHLATTPEVRAAWERWRARPGLAVPDLRTLEKKK